MRLADGMDEAREGMRISFYLGNGLCIYYGVACEIGYEAVGVERL